MADEKTAVELAADIKAAHAEAIDKVKEMAETALGKAEAGEKLSEGVKQSTDEALTKMNELTEQVSQMEQKMSRVRDAMPERKKSIGERYIEDEAVKNWLNDSPSKGKADLRVKATLTTATTDADGSVGAGADSQRLSGILTTPNRRMTVRDLLAQGRMSEASIEYVQEVGFNNNAAPVAEGAKKPESDIQLDLKSTSAKVIAHWMKASRQALDDVHQLRSHIDGRLMYGLEFAEENQLLNGDGTGQNLDGLINQATAFSAPVSVAGATNIDNIRLAMLQAVLAEYPASGTVMHPSDWALIELEKETTGAYVIGQPQGVINATLWGLPVVATQAIAVDKFLTGSFNMGAQVWDKWDARVEVGFENDDFTKNLVTILAEERLALTVYRPESFIYGDFGNVA